MSFWFPEPEEIREASTDREAESGDFERRGSKTVDLANDELDDKMKNLE